MTNQTYCSRHSDTVTSLRCGRCEDPICTQCMVSTPVGFRCRECAQVRPSPVYDVSTAYLARALGASLGIGAAAGVLLALLRFVLGGYLSGIALAGLGLAIAEGVSWAANRKRGRTLQYVAAGGMAAALLVMVLLNSYGYGGFLNIFDIIGAGVGIYLAVTRLR